LKTFPTRLDLIRDLPPNSTGAEIGVYAGGFSAEILSTPVKKIYLVDAWDASVVDPRDALAVDQGGQDALYRSVVGRFMNESINGRVQILKQLSIDAAFELWLEEIKLDFIYLDACHTYEAVKMDLSAWSQVIADGGCIMGHDYLDNDRTREMGFGVIKAVTEFCNERGWILDALTLDEWPSYRLVKK
jgi:hypothetical protein